MSGEPRGRQLSAIEVGCLVAVLVVAVVSLVLANVNRGYFEKVFTQEDEFIENLTVVGLAGAALVCGYRAWALRRARSRLFVSVSIFLAVMYGTAAAEEISWGQRLFHVKTPEFFAAHNAQRETNIHNLRIGSTQIKRVVEFARGIVLTVYWVALPLVWPFWRRGREVTDRLGIPMPRLRHAVVFVAASLLVDVIPSVRGGEVDECVIGMMSYIITAYPINVAAFRRLAS